MNGDLGACRNTVSDLVRREVVTRARQCKLCHRAEIEAARDSPNGNGTVFFIGLVAGEKARSSVEFGRVHFDAAFGHEAYETMKGGEARVAKRLARASTGGNFSMEDRRSFRCRRGVVVHASEGAF